MRFRRLARVLLDEQIRRHFALELRAHEVSTVQQKGWAGLKNGELLRCAADAGFEVFVTADRKRNQDRFPVDFMFELSKEEYDALRSQFGTLKRGEHSQILTLCFYRTGGCDAFECVTEHAGREG